MRSDNNIKLSDNVTAISGVGPKKAELLKKMNIHTVEDLLYLFPRKYEDRRHAVTIIEAPFNQDVLLETRVVTKQISGNPYGKKRLLRVLAEDNTGSVELLFFNGKYLADYFKPGQALTLFGNITLNNGRRQMVHPEFHTTGDKDDVRGLFPVYPLTDGLYQGQMRSMQLAVRETAKEIKEWLPEYIVKENNLCSPAYAIENIHFPKAERPVLESRYRLIFEELLTLQSGLFYIKRGRESSGQGVSVGKGVSLKPFLEVLPFNLTEGQERTIKQIECDLESSRAMNRLIQGDVGSGKTAVAELAMYKTVRGGFQAAMMAPTELLAKQHAATLKKHFEPLGINVRLLSGNTKARERSEILEDLETGDVNILVGTHAVIRPDVRFANLGLVITDEQHRFGVNQRTLLAQKGENPNILVMTATPIPRTLAVILYGDLDISVIDTLPAGRKPVRTFLRYGDSRKKIYDFVENQIKEGRQAYVVAPLIEESEAIDCKSAGEIYEELCKSYPNLRIGLVHGAMKQQEKDFVMEAFASGGIDILVSTVVIEVGIDVGNATVMVIENCERFGLAQLHQLRGRVGRSGHQSYCILVCGSDSETAKKRNKIMCSTEDGFVIAEEDLKLRGPGEIFGTRQHGLPELNITDLVKNADMLEKVKNVARDLIDRDSELELPEHTELKKRVKKMFGEKIELRL
ncbi:MAG: ATP-dependent DNA helicase RecG [Firmicutes bacterium]|nr:ATP-dependent DNA helicase RecG [Bacillota bacterium]